MGKTIVNLGPVEQISLGKGKSFVVQGQEVAVFRGTDERIFAIQNRCPHGNVPLADGVLGRETIMCPGHGHKFNLLTGQGREHGECVRTFKVWEENQDILLEYP